MYNLGVEVGKMIEEKKLILAFEENGLYLPEVVEKLISEQPKIGEWIPCSERLPEESGCYLCTMRYHEVMICEYKFNRSNSKKEFFRNGCVTNILAWQPLPSPYTGG